jgi:ribosome-associated translation inhibitor RaiA
VPLKEYLVEKLQLARKSTLIIGWTVRLYLSVAKNPSIAKSQKAEVTIKVNGNVIRGEEVYRKYVRLN